MHLVIIGNGITGITTARHVRKNSDCRITVISSESEYFFSRTALMYIFMGHMKEENTRPYEKAFWKKNRIDLVHDHVTRIDSSSKTCHLKNGAPLSFDQLVIATGSRPNNMGINFSEYQGVQGLYSLQDLSLLKKNTEGIRRATVVGGGLIGMELAEMLLSRNIAVTLLVRESSYWNNVLPAGESQMVTRHILSHGIDLRLQTTLNKIIADDSGKVTAISTDSGEEIPCDFVGITIGVTPNIDLLKDSGIETGRGVLVNEFLETNLPGIYAAGDCAEFRNPAAGQVRIEQLWYTGRMQAKVLAQNLCGHRTTYDRGIWFNSAKFFDVEYQSYGFVPAALPDTHENLYWENEREEKCLHIVFEKESRAVAGFNVLGMRYRHRICEQWILEKKPIDYVIDHLHEANFDGEFFKKHENEIKHSFSNIQLTTAAT